MATKTLGKIVRYGGAKSNPLYYPIAATQTWKIGQLVYLDTSGRATVCADNGVLTIGLAMTDEAAPDTDTLVPIDVILPGDRLVVSVYHATAASALLPNSSVGDPFELVVSSNKCYLDIAGYSTNMFKIIGRMPEDSATDVYPRAIVTIPSACLQSVDAAQG